MTEHLQSLIAQRCVVTHVHEDDAQEPSLQRAARVLVAYAADNESEQKAQAYLAVTRSERFRVYGTAIPASVANEPPWIPLHTPVAWRPSLVAVVTTLNPLTLDFLAPSATEEARRSAALELVAELQEGAETPQDPELQAARLEHADQALGGSPLTIAALQVIGERYPNCRDESLPRRLVECRPEGLAAWHREASPLRHLDPALRTALLDALAKLYEQADSACLDASFWPDARRQTITGWWVACKASNRGLRSVAKEYGIPAPPLRELFSGRFVPEAMHAVRGLPGLDDMVADIPWPFPADQVSAPIAAVHTARLDLLSRQQSSLERRCGNISRHTQWSSLRRQLADVVSSGKSLQTWKRAYSVAGELRGRVLGTRDEPIGIDRVLSEVGATIASVTLAADGQVGAWAGAGAPVLGMAPSALRRAGGARFAAMHMLGHAIEALASGASSIAPCRLFESGLELGDEEAFANAFAAALLAPHDTVRRLVDTRPHTDSEWLDASRDVSATFGLSPIAGLFHLHNAYKDKRDEPIKDAVNRQLAGDAGQKHIAVVNAEVTDRWRCDLEWLRREAADTDDGQDAPSLEAALRRPRSRRFEGLLDQAAREGLLSRDTLEAMRAS